MVAILVICYMYFLLQWMVFSDFVIVFKDLPVEIRRAQEKKLEELKKHQEIQSRLTVERKIQLRDRKIKFFGTLVSLCDLLCSSAR